MRRLWLAWIVIVLLVVLAASIVGQALGSSPRHGVGMPGCVLPVGGVAQLGDWYFNWTSEPTGGVAGIEFVPMAWAGQLSTWSDGKAKYLLVFNEPDIASQANLTPTVAAQRYRALRKLVLGKDPDVRFIVGGTATGAAWCQQFITEYERQFGAGAFRADGWHFHVYTGGNAGAAQSAIEAFRSWWQGLPCRQRGEELWLTETGVLGAGDAAAYMRWLLSYLPQSGLTRVAWYSVNDDCKAENWGGLR